MNTLAKTYGIFGMIDPRLDELYMENALRVGLVVKSISVSDSTEEDEYDENEELTVQEDNK